MLCLDWDWDGGGERWGAETRRTPPGLSSAGNGIVELGQRSMREGTEMESSLFSSLCWGSKRIWWKAMGEHFGFSWGYCGSPPPRMHCLKSSSPTPISRGKSLGNLTKRRRKIFVVQQNCCDCQMGNGQYKTMCGPKLLLCRASCVNGRPLTGTT